MKSLSIIISLISIMFCLYGCTNEIEHKDDPYRAKSFQEELTETITEETEYTTPATITTHKDTDKSATEYQDNITTFNLSDYQDSIDFFEKNNINVTVGEIRNYNDAVEQAKIVWSVEMEYHTYEGRDIKIYYNEEADCWLAKLATNWDYFHEQMNEGIYVLSCDPCVIIRSDGKVLAYWTE